MKYNGNWNRIAKAIANQEAIQSERNVRAITIIDSEYPDSLRALRYPPWCLFYQGDISLLQKQCMSIVGSRQINLYGKCVTQMSAKILSKKYVIVSGLAKGADTIAHQITIDQKGKTIGVIASGLSIHYPYCNEMLYQTMFLNHLVISEYPFYVGIQKHHFAWRNRIIAALGKSCIVTSAQKKSGTMLTVNEAIALGKDVYCFPYPIDEKQGEGCNALIQDGAYIVYDYKQLEGL